MKFIPSSCFQLITTCCEPGCNGSFNAPLVALINCSRLSICNFAKRAPSGNLTLSGRIRGQDWVHQVAITRVSEQSGLSKLWARERISDLTHQIQFGGNRERLRASILALALEHHLVSDFTSLVAVDEVVVRPPGSSGQVEQVPTSAPTGTYWATSGFSKTATPAELLLDCGLLCMTFGYFMVWTKSRKTMAR